jgi:hypothetical protein
MGIQRLNPGNQRYTGFLKRHKFAGLTSQGAKTSFQVLASITGTGYLDRAFINTYWTYMAGHWLRFRIVVDGVVRYDHLIDASTTSFVGDGSFGIAHSKYAVGGWSADTGVGEEWFMHPSFANSGQGMSKARIRALDTSLVMGLPPAISGSTNDVSAAFGVTAITEPIYFNSSLSIEVSAANGPSVQGAIVISGGII